MITIALKKKVWKHKLDKINEKTWSKSIWDNVIDI
jgi:hypothetical protein